MLGPMATRVEVWPVAADEVGIWLVSGDDAWRPGLPVMADGDPHFDVEMELSRHGVTEGQATLIHSTSWRVDGPSCVHTYIAVIPVDGLVRDQWPDALPVSLSVTQTVGKPLPHEAAEPPTPRYIDVLMHGLRHLRFLLDTDSTAAAALVDPWPTYLAELEPVLAGMYQAAESAIARWWAG